MSEFPASGDLSLGLADLPSPQRRVALRKAAIAAREALAPHAHAAASARIAEYVLNLLGHLAPQRVGFCWPWRGEPDLRAALEGWRAAAARRALALPVVQERGQALAFQRWTPGAEMALDAHGIAIPRAGEVLQPDVLLIPLNAFDAAGYRIGYGGGYFDRSLATLTPRPQAVGVGFELGRVADTWPQAHDVAMDWLITEAGCWKITADLSLR